MAAGVVMLSSVVVLLTAWERLSSVRSLDTRNAIEQLLAEPALDGFGLDVEGAISILYVSGVVSALCAVATAILGWYVLKPDTSARRAVSILAVPLFLTGLTAGGFAASFVAAGAAMLWMQPAKEWFATGKWTPPAPPPSIERTASSPSPFDAPGRSADATPPPVAGPHPTPGPAPSPYASAPRVPQAPAPSVAGPPVRRPQAVTTAFVLTVVMAGGGLLLSLLSLVVVGMSPDLLMTELERQRPELVADGLTVEQMQASTYVAAGVSVVWCAVALVFAGFAMARRGWARRAWMITAAFSAGGCLLVALSAPFLVVPAVAGAATATLLARPETRHWFASR